MSNIFVVEQTFQCGLNVPKTTTNEGKNNKRRDYYLRHFFFFTFPGEQERREEVLGTPKGVHFTDSL